MTADIRKAAVLGAGTMGSRIAAHLANAGVDCLLLDLPAPGESPAARTAIVQRAFKDLSKAKPPAFFTAGAAQRLALGNFEDDLDRIADADWIVEAIVERFEPKVELLEKVDRLRKPTAIVSSNTSGLPIGKLAEGRSEEFRRHWMGSHFFNPPRYMRLLELIPAPDTDPQHLETIRRFCDRVLGKTVVPAKDRPNFIANRIFLFSMMHALRTMLAQGLTVEEVDALTGPLIGRPRMATFRLADFTGVDVCVYVAGNLYQLVPEDEKREVYAPPEFLKKMVAMGIVGDKAGRGFYTKDSQAPGGRLVLDLESLQYRERIQPNWPSVAEARKLPNPADRIKSLIASQDPAGAFLWTTLSELFLYAAARIPEVCDDIVAIDAVMKAGFNWQRGLFELWDELGLEATCDRMRSEGKTLPPLVERALQSPAKSFYASSGGTRTFFDLQQGDQRPIPAVPGVLRLDQARTAKPPVASNPSASLWDLGDGVALLEFHSKANALDQHSFVMLHQALETVEREFDALVLGNEGENFCVGVNLQMVLGLALQRRFDELERQIQAVQSLVVSIRRRRQPVVAAVFGQTLAGGCEIAMRCSCIQAAAETYIGLVETGVGLIPAAGGCAEMIRRRTADLDPRGNIAGPIRSVFEMIGAAKVANSAEEAREWRYLRLTDGITMNRDRLLAEAKRTALGLAADGYRPAPAETVLAGGRGVRAELELGLWMLRQASYISEFDVKIGKKLANVLAGGDLTEPGYVSDERLLQLEREAFLSLSGEPQTLQRIEHLLKTGKPLRN